MYPVLIDIGPLTIFTYGFFVAFGIIVAIFFARHEGKRLGVNPDRIMDMSFYIVVAAIVGSRLLYVATNWSFFVDHPLDVFKIWHGGLVFYGGFIGAFIVAFIFIRKYRMPLARTGDIAAVSVPLGHVFGRLGCFFAGCCYGEASSLPWAVTFQHPQSLAPHGIGLHPTQLYSAIANLLIFLVLFSVRKRKRFDGQIFWMYILLYGVTRSVIELFRGDYRGEFILGIISISQFIGLSLAAVSLAVLIVMGRRYRNT